MACLECVLGQHLDPKFAPFEGEAYRVPKEWRTIGYGPYIEDLEPFQSIKWNKINVKDRFTDEPFMDINFNIKSFGVVLHSTMKIEESACYAFNLISDDGSRLWIDEKEIINHDGDHQMKLKTDTVFIEKGVRNVTLWYYQAFPTNYGFIFEGKYVGKCPPQRIDVIELNAELIFGHNESQLRNDFSIDTILEGIEVSNIDSIVVVGHTSSIGTSLYNMILSKKRANSIARILKQTITGVPIYARGEGETSLKYDESNPLGDNKNRRVELVLYLNDQSVGNSPTKN